MKNEIFIELFRFNAQTDYLPYYQKHTLEYNDSDTINDLLIQMNRVESFGFKENMNLKVNDLYTNANVLVVNMVEKFGNEIKIDSISEFRAQKDLIIDRSDFIDKLLLLDDFMDAQTNIEYRKSTELAYYASNTLNYNREYIGDHILIIAADLIEKKFELKNDILELLTNNENGIWLHTSIENRVGCDVDEKKIQKLLYLAKEYIIPSCKIQKKIKSVFKKEALGSFEQNTARSTSKIVQNFDGFNIAAYHGIEKSNLDNLILDSKAVCIKIPSNKEDLASNAILLDENFSFKIAGDILMQAKDENADFVLVKNDETKEFFDKNQEQMEKLTGRDLGMSILSQDQFVQILEGEKDPSKLGFNEHKVKVSFLSKNRVF
ncbi:hypothetical protein JHD50_13440 [Sulfurimonas sp. MAG313]|nr:hypothetical protein [Sulfurimonas sp. MAG313]MDF1882292.1 hypothetical protein [Sulfurimonas sp. MAG313]